jgi:hypothetical protein
MEVLGLTWRTVSFSLTLVFFKSALALSTYNHHYIARWELLDYFQIEPTETNGCQITDLVIHFVHQRDLSIQFLKVTVIQLMSITYYNYHITRNTVQQTTSFISDAMFFKVSSPSPITSKPSSCTILSPKTGYTTWQIERKCTQQQENMKQKEGKWLSEFTCFILRISYSRRNWLDSSVPLKYSSSKFPSVCFM